jgi:hypothetical protein
MSSSLLKQKLIAAVWHFLVTVVVAFLSGLLIFKVWYPGGLAAYVGGVELYKLVVLVELCLGPIMSLVIFNSAKPRLELFRDYLVVALIQLSALAYGLYVVAESRPAFVVFVKDRLEVVAAVELTAADYVGASGAPFDGAAWFGPRFICVEPPVDIKERNDLLFSAVGGRDIQYFPKYYRNCGVGEREGKTYPGNRLHQIIEGLDQVGQFNLPEGEFTWLPVKHRFGAFVEVYPDNDFTQGYYVAVNPFGE